MAVMFVLILASVSMAAQTNNTLNVNLDLAHHATIEVLENIDFGTIDFSEGYGIPFKIGKVQLSTNDDVWVTVRSRGFQDSNGNPMDTLNSWTQYMWSPGNGTPVYTQAGKSQGGWGNLYFSFTGEKIDISIRALIAHGGNWFNIQAGEYNDTVTVTVWPK